jgi:ABC-2 type transport system ATP-binding protein
LKTIADVLNVQNLTKKFGGLTAVNDVSFSVKKGSIIGILGPNGSGKTTTLAILLGIIKQDSGDFTWHDNQTNTNSNIGALIETPNFYPYLSLKNNLRVICEIKNVPQSDILRVLTTVKLDGRINSRFDSLSLGMKQRLAIASLLLGNPDVLVLDEPTNGLDPQGIAEVRTIIKNEASQGKTIILASHILDEVEKVCNQVIILKSGKLIAQGKVNEILNKSDSLIISTERLSDLKLLIDNSGMTEKTKIIDFDLHLTLCEGIKITDISQFASEKGFVLTKIEQQKSSLEKHYLEAIR